MENKNIEYYKKKFEHCSKMLKKTEWPPMTYMLIPSVLEESKNLLKELQFYQGENMQEVELLAKELEFLIRQFKRK